MKRFYLLPIVCCALSISLSAQENNGTATTSGADDNRITFLPVNSVLLSSENKKNRVNEAAAVDRRTVGYRRRVLSMQKGTLAMLELLKAAKKAAVPASYVLFDSWFSSPSTLHAVKSIGYDVIGSSELELTRA